MPISRPRRGSQDFGPRGAGQFDEIVRVQRPSATRFSGKQDTTWDDLVSGGTPESIAASQRYVSIVARNSENEEAAQFAATSKTSRKVYDVRMWHEPTISTQYRFLWRGQILNISESDHQSERRAGYSTFVCVSVGNAPAETLGDGSTIGGGPEPNTSGEISNLPIT